MGLGRQYSWRNVRATFNTIPFGLIRLAGKSNGSPTTATFNNEQTATYSVVDGNGVHVGTVDQDGGSIAVPLQVTSDADTLVDKLCNYQKIAKLFVKGTLTIEDINGSGVVAVMSDAVLSNQPGISFGEEQPERNWTWTGFLVCTKNPIIPVLFGPTPSALP